MCRESKERLGFKELPVTIEKAGNSKVLDHNLIQTSGQE